MNMSILIRNGQLLNTTGDLEQNDILIENGAIKTIAKEINTNADEVIDAAGKVIAPGFIDLHVHLREPGGEK